MKKRHIPRVERLEPRETPDVALGSAALGSFPFSAPLSASPPVSPAAVAPAPQTREALSRAALDAVFAADARPDTDADGLQGWLFLRNYTRKAIRNEEQRYGALSDHEDLVHQVFVEWWEHVGPRPEAFAGLLSRDSPEHFVLRKTVRRVLDHARYERTRDRRIGELFEQPEPPRPAEQVWRDVRLDWETGATGPGPRERRVLELRREGRTLEEIGAELGLLKQRVSELYGSAVEQLRQQYES